MKKMFLIIMSFVFGIANISAAPLGSQVQFNSVAVQSDNKSVAAGNVIIQGVMQGLIVRYGTNGLMDATFGTAGIVTILVSDSTSINAVALQSDSKIVVAGVVDNSGNQIFVARYTSTGVLDTTFNSTGIVTTAITGSDASQANAILVQSDGKIVVGGLAVISGTSNFMVARYNVDGSLDTSFNSAGDQPGIITTAINDAASVSAIALQSTDDIIASGTSLDGSDFQFTSVRYTSSGTLDTSYGTSGISTVLFGSGSVASSNAVLSDDSILIGGSYNINNFVVAKFTSDGALDTSFGASGIAVATIGVSAQANAMVVQPSDEKIVVVGTSVLTNEGFVALARFETDGSLDSTFGTGGIVTTALGFNAVAYGVALQSDEKIIIDGFTDANALIIRYLSTGLRDVLFAADGVNPTPTGNPAFPSILQSITFVAEDFSKDAAASPDTNFDNVYGSTPPLIAFKSWQMVPSSSTQEPLTLQFDMPIDLDSTWDPTIDLKLFIANNSGSGSVVNIQLRIDLKVPGQQIGVVSPATGFSQTITSGDVTVTPEPASGNLKNVRVSMPVSGSTIAPRSTVVVVIDRVATTDTEYDNNVYLGSMVFRYRKILN